MMRRQWPLVVFSILSMVFGGGILSFGPPGALAYEKYPTLFTDHNQRPNRPWRHLASTEREALLALLEILERSKTGKRVMAAATVKAHKMGKTLTDVIQLDDHSKTDTILSRKFYAQHPENVVYEERSSITLNKELSVADAVQDLAHELTHFTWRTPFNPYREDFGVRDLIKNTIEGPGGEVDAYLVECRVWNELWRGQTGSSNCLKVYDEERRVFSREKAIKLFYQLGPYLDAWQTLAQYYHLNLADFGAISGRPTMFTSSYYALPYPIAAIKEFRAIRQKTCANEEKRLRLLRKRFPSDDLAQQSAIYQRLGQRYQRQCQDQQNYAAELVGPDHTTSSL